MKGLRVTMHAGVTMHTTNTTPSQVPRHRPMGPLVQQWGHVVEPACALIDWAGVLVCCGGDMKRWWC